MRAMARVSSDEQRTASQLAELREWAAGRGLEVVTEYVLDGESAWTGTRRGPLRQVLEDARLGRFDVLLVWALDRLTGSGVLRGPS
jgi:DNA invertase Pin-like site-specific DNA recombinase